MPVSEPAGRLLYALTRATAPALVVKFGMSYGISTLYTSDRPSLPLPRTVRSPTTVCGRLGGSCFQTKGAAQRPLLETRAIAKAGIDRPSQSSLAIREKGTRRGHGPRIDLPNALRSATRLACEPRQ